MPGSGPSIDPLVATQALNLGEAGYAGRQIARILGLSAGSVDDILHGHGRWGVVTELPVFRRLRAEQKTHLEAASRVLAAKCLIQVDKTLDKTSAYQAAGIYGLLRTHERLDAGEATVNVELHVKGELVGMEQLCAALSRTLVDVSRETPVDTLHDNSINPPK